MTRTKQVDFAVLTVYLIAVTALIFLLRLNYLIGTILYFFVPSLYLTLRHWKIYKHVALFSWTFGLIFGFVSQTIALANNLWDWDYSQLPILGGKTIEGILWYVLYVWVVIVIYRVFVDRHRHAERGGIIKRHVTWWLVIFSLLFVFFTLHSLKIEAFTAPYVYAELGFAVIVAPIVYFAIKHPKLMPGLLKTGLVLFILSLLYEIAGLHLGWYHYPGEFLGVIKVADIALPIEELVFWIVLGAMAMVAWYEEFEFDLA